MKRDVTKFMILLAFLFQLLAILLSETVLELTTILASGIYYVFIVCFVFAENKTIVRFGYAFAALLGVGSLASVLSNELALESINGIFSLLTSILLLASSCIFLTRKAVAYYGYVKVDTVKKEEVVEEKK